MHLVLIIVILMLAFPGFRHFVGGILSLVFWLIAGIVVVAIFDVMSP